MILNGQLPEISFAAANAFVLYVFCDDLLMHAEQLAGGSPRNGL
jgi:hypothetical protein